MIGLRARILCGLSGCLLAVGLVGVGCTDSGTPAASAGADTNGAATQDLLISFNEEPGSKLLVSAKTPDGSEIAVFGDKDEQGRIQRISQIDLLLGRGGETVSVALDERERPLRVEIDDRSEATFAYDVDAGTVRAEVVNSDGAITVTEVSDPAEQADADDAGDAEDARALGRPNLCGRLRALRRVLDEFFNCDGDAADPTLCGGSLERATALLRDLCSLDSVDVEGLATRFGDGPRPMPLGIRPHFTARPAPDGGTTVVLVAVAFGGARPYDQVEWSWLVGPEEVPVENLPAWTAVADLVVPGTYVFRAEVIDGEGHQASADIEVSTEQLLEVIIRLEPGRPDVGQVVQFRGDVSPGGPIQFFHWRFGDGNANTGARVTHAYTEPGEYAVRLVVAMKDGRRATGIKIVRIGAPNECVLECRELGEQVLQDCLEEGGDVDDCEAMAQEFIGNCVEERCEGPGECRERCLEHGEQIFHECREEGGSIEECEALAREFVGHCVETQCEGPAQCQRECLAQGRRIFEECREEGGGVEECEALAREFVGHCIETQCEGPAECRRECLAQGRRIFEECREEGGGVEQCEAMAREFVGHCIDTQCEGPAQCRRECFELGRGVFEECREEGGSVEECEDLAREFVENCLRENCDPHGECQRECHEQGEEIFDECMDEIDNEEECNALRREFVEGCLDEHCDPPGSCQSECRLAGQAVFRECVGAGDEPAKCNVLRREFVEECLDEHCDPPGSCQSECSLAGQAVFQECVGAGGQPEECNVLRREFVEECLALCEG